MLGFFACMWLAVIGLWLGLRMDRMFAGAIFALVAWDMTEFGVKLRLLSPREDARGIERRHLLRVGLMAAAGTLLGFLFDWLAVR